MFRLSIQFALLLLGVVHCCSAAETTLTQQQLSDFFDTGWKPSAAAVKVVNAEYGSLLQAAPGDQALESAYLLLLLRQRQYDAALVQSTKLIRTDPNDLSTLRARVWTLTLDKKYEAALVELESMARAIATPRMPVLDKEVTREQTEFVGRVWAFINGPAKTTLNAGTLETAQRRIVEKLGPEREPLFRAGVVAVAEKFANLDQELKQTKATTIADEEQQKEKLRVLLAQQKVDLNNEQNELDAQLSKLRGAAETQLQQIDTQLGPIQRQLVQFDNQINVITSNVLLEENQIASWLSVANNARNPVEYNQALAQVQVHEQLRANYLNNVASLQSQSAGVRSQANQLAGQRQALVYEYNEKTGPLERRLREIGGQRTRIANDEKKALQPSTGITTQTTSFASKVSGFLTYEDYPFELERQRIQSLGK